MSSKPDVKSERQAQIIQAALTCFSRNGYNNTTMDDIVAESGLSKGTLYWYFKGKQDLFVSMINSLITEIGDQALTAIEQQASSPDKVRALGAAFIRFGELADGFVTLMAEFWAQSEDRESAGQLWAGLLREYHRAVTAVIEEGINTGEFRQVDAAQLVWAAIAAYDGLAFYKTVMPELELERVNQAFVDALLEGLQATE